MVQLPSVSFSSHVELRVDLCANYVLEGALRANFRLDSREFDNLDLLRLLR